MIRSSTASGRRRGSTSPPAWITAPGQAADAPPTWSTVEGSTREPVGSAEDAFTGAYGESYEPIDPKPLPPQVGCVAEEPEAVGIAAGGVLESASEVETGRRERSRLIALPWSHSEPTGVTERQAPATDNSPGNSPAEPKTATELWVPLSTGTGVRPGRRPVSLQPWELNPGDEDPPTAEQVPAFGSERSLTSYEPVGIGEACGFAARFAADYLSWDEDEPERRAAALRQYLADPTRTDLGWSGTGRQRADLVAPGRTARYQGVVVVEITARVVLYQRTPTPRGGPWPGADDAAGEEAWPPAGEPAPALAIAPASAPPPTATGWRAGSGWWVQVAPPVRRHHDGRLVVDLALDLSEMQP